MDKEQRQEIGRRKNYYPAKFNPAGKWLEAPDFSTLIEIEISRNCDLARWRETSQKNVSIGHWQEIKTAISENYMYISYKAKKRIRFDRVEQYTKFYK